MQLFQTLAAQVAVFGPHFDVALNFIGKLIRGIITGVSSVGVGIILFSLILKVIVLPVDVMQRITMRKHNIKMEENKERMEKLVSAFEKNLNDYNRLALQLTRTTEEMKLPESSARVRELSSAAVEIRQELAVTITKLITSKTRL